MLSTKEKSRMKKILIVGAVAVVVAVAVYITSLPRNGPWRTLPDKPFNIETGQNGE